MPYEIKFNTKDYLNDLKKLQEDIKKNGTAEKVYPVKIIFNYYEGSQETIQMYINFAYNQDNNEGTKSSLYTVAFGNKSNVFRFNPKDNKDENKVIEINKYINHELNTVKESKLFIKKTLTGSYTDLGTVEQISISSICNAVKAVNSYENKDTNKEQNNNIGRHLTTLIVSVNEALRFDFVRKGIFNLLNNKEPKYMPDWNRITNWKSQNFIMTPV